MTMFQLKVVAVQYETGIRYVKCRDFMRLQALIWGLQGRHPAAEISVRITVNNGHGETMVDWDYMSLGAMKRRIAEMTGHN